VKAELHICQAVCEIFFFMADEELRIRALGEADWLAVRAIYLEGIATDQATFETEAPTWEAWDATHLRAPRLVAFSDGRVIGWAALGRVSARAVYAGVAEVSVYVANSSRGLGVGRALLVKLIADSEANNIWTLQANIFPENTASLALHKSCGFREVGRRERIGRMKGIWRDTILLERRSHKVGLD
jgi:L-amino acid N-acyltransferase YncA